MEEREREWQKEDIQQILQSTKQEGIPEIKERKELDNAKNNAQ